MGAVSFVMIPLPICGGGWIKLFQCHQHFRIRSSSVPVLTTTQTHTHTVEGVYLQRRSKQLQQMLRSDRTRSPPALYDTDHADDPTTLTDRNTELNTGTPSYVSTRPRTRRFVTFLHIESVKIYWSRRTKMVTNTAIIAHDACTL